MLINDIANEVQSWLYRADAITRREFIETDRNQLHIYHHSLGRSIRNHFNLWQEQWVPKIVNGVDVSESHPETISMKVIEEVWQREQHLYVR